MMIIFDKLKENMTLEFEEFRKDTTSLYPLLETYIVERCTAW